MRYLFFLFIPVFALEGFCQQTDYLRPHFQVYDDANMVYTEIQPFVSSMVSSDFGPRRIPGYNWHSGIDFTCDQCEDHLVLSCLGGQFYYGEAGGLRYVVVDGTSDLAYLHLFTNLNAGNCHVLKMSGKPKFNVVVIDYNGVILAFAEETGQVSYNGMLHDVVDYIHASQPLGPIGGSGGYPIHLHIEQLPDGVNTISNDMVSKNPLQTLHYDVPVYTTINMFYSPTNNLNNITEGIDIKYPGTKSNSILIRPVFPNGLHNGSRFNTLNNVNSIELNIRNTSLNGNWEIISGPNYNSEIKYGGLLGADAYPDKILNTSGSFNVTGVYPDAYADSQPKEFDNFFFSDFFHRIHNDDQMSGTKSMLISYCPEDSRYVDGTYEFKSILKTINGDITDGELYSDQIDNFQPYIKSVDVLIDGINIYSASWDCTHDGPEFSGYECRSTDVSANSVITVNVSTSEALSQLSGRILEFPGLFIPFYHQGGLQWTASFQNFNYLKDGDVGHLEFAGTDIKGNQILDMKAMSGGTVYSQKPVPIPIRESETNWKPSRKGGDIDNVHEFCFKNCTKLMEVDVENNILSPDCISTGDLNLTYEQESFNGSGDGWIHLEITGGVPPYYIVWKNQSGNIIKKGINLFDLTDLTAGTYCYSVQDDHCCEIHSCITICPSITLNVVTGITNPSDCQLNDGNIRIINASANGGRMPYEYHLEDIHGNHLPQDPATGKYENLYAGKYFLIATDQNGCTGSFTIELVSPEDFYMFPNVTKACDGDNGKISIEAFSSNYPDDKYHFKWSTGFEESDVVESMIDQLAIGKYCVIVTSNTTQCSKEDCFEIKGSGKPLTLKSTSRIPCPNQKNGEIQLTVTGGSKPYNYNWSHGDFRSGTTHLGAGVYCVTITDDCLNSIKQCTDLSEVLSANLDMEYKCPKNVNVYSFPKGGNPPYTFLWSNGANTKDLIEVPVGGFYKVTITDKFNCTIEKEINTNPIELLNPVKPCEGFWDGEITIKINNPKNESVYVSYDYRPCDDCLPLDKIYDDHSNPVIFTLKELAGNKEYHFNVWIGLCYFEIRFELGEEGLHEEFNRYEETNGLASCIYDLVCKDNRIVEGKRTGADLKQVGGNCKKFIFKECANVEVRCMGHPDLIKTIPGKKVHMRRLELIMYAQKLGLDASALSGNFCDHVWICQEDPFCIVATARGELGGKFKGIVKDGDCWKVKCRSFFGLINQDYWICGEHFIPDDFLPFYRNDRNYEDAGGKPRPSDCTPMTLNFTDVLECWSKFVMDDGEKFYNSKLAALVDSYRDRRERYCAWVTFCLEDYSVIKSNINDFECQDFHPPIDFGNWTVYSTCEPHHFEGNDIVFCECNDPEIEKKYGICLEPKVLPRSCTLALKSSEDPKAIQFIPIQQGNTYFNCFSTFYQPEDFTTINGIFEDEAGTSYYQKYEPGEIYNKLEEFEGALFANKNAKTDRINLISRGNSNREFEIYSGNYNSIDFSVLSCTDSLKFLSFCPLANGFAAFGEFNGELFFNSESISSESGNGVFILNRNDDSNLTEINILTGAMLLNKNSKYTSHYLFQRIPGQQVMRLNGNEIHPGNDANTFLLSTNESGSIQVQPFMNISNNFKIKELQVSSDGLNYYLLGTANNNISIGNTSINLPGEMQIVLFSCSPNGLNWIKNFDQVGIDIQNMFLEYLNDKGIALGLNVDGESTLFTTNPYYEHSQGKDIVIINYDPEGRVVYNKRFGSVSDDEELKALYYSEEKVLYLGGNITGTSSMRPIGDLNIIKANSIEHSAFISYIDFNAQEQYTEFRKEQHVLNDNVAISILNIQPNPVLDLLNIEIVYYGDDRLIAEVVDLTGKTFNLPSRRINGNILLNTQSLVSGIYFLKLSDGTGNIAIKRFVKH